MGKNKVRGDILALKMYVDVVCGCGDDAPLFVLWDSRLTIAIGQVCDLTPQNEHEHSER